RLDYLHNSGTITIPAGQTAAVGAVLLEQDDLPEGDERFAVELTDPKGATLADAVGAMTITDDD
ncbi:MAG: hyalin, partial [bacterium]|nr:hyalin [bacterium]